MRLKPVIISTLFLFMFFVHGYSQTNNLTKSDRYYLVGTWLQESRSGNEFIVFKRKIGKQKDASGFQIELSNNGAVNLKHRKSARKCGNDYRKSISKGKWSLDSDNRVLKTTIPIIIGFQKFKIIELDNRKMVLSLVKSE